MKAKNKIHITVSANHLIAHKRIATQEQKIDNAKLLYPYWFKIQSRDHWKDLQLSYGHQVN